MHAFFNNDSFQFAVENALGETYHRASDVGEVLATSTDGATIALRVLERLQTRQPTSTGGRRASGPDPHGAIGSLGQLVPKSTVQCWRSAFTPM